VARLLVLLFFLTLRLAQAGAASDLARQLQQASLDPQETYRVSDINFSKEDIKIYLTSGYLIFAKPIAGIRPGAVFVASAEGGDGEVLLMPPVRSERLSLATFTEAPNLEEHFKAIVMVLTDATANNLLAQIQASPTAKKLPEMGGVLTDQWDPVFRNLTGSFETRLVYDLLSTDRKSGMFYIAVSGNNLGNFDVLNDPTAHEQIFAGKLVYRDNRTYFDTWTSFPSRSARNGAASDAPRFVLDNFRIESTIDPDLKMHAVTRATLTPKQNVARAVPINISGNMRVTEASIDGRAVEVFEHDSLRSNLIFSTGNHQVLLVCDAPLDPAKPHEVEIHHEGAVILKAGADVYYIASRTNWYPRLGLDLANYELTFRYPKNLLVVATGNPVDDRTDGIERITRYKTESPVRLAGFNLGNYQSVSTTLKGYNIEVYANRHLESALAPKAPPPPALPPPTPFGRPRRSDPLLTEPTPPPPDPVGRLQLLAKDVAGALDFMMTEFGPPPMRTLAITPIPGGFGQGFPGLVYLSTLAYIDPEQRPAALRERTQQTFYSELLEAHEVAHQWWGNMVIPASYQDEWLMESLANYSALLLLEKKKGIKAVDAVLDDYKKHLLAKLESGNTLESAGPITWGYRLQSSVAPNAWRTVTYEKGTWIIHMLRRRLGDQKFKSLLHEVCDRYRFSTISTEQFRELAREYAPPKSPDPTLRAFFDNWVYGTGIPAVKLTYSWRGTRLTGTVSQRGVDDDFTAFVPVEIVAGRQRTVHWLATGSDPVSFSIPMKVAPTRVALLPADCLITIPK